jgi:outer membrane receptor for ferrienterochelin and colicins
MQFIKLSALALLLSVISFLSVAQSGTVIGNVTFSDQSEAAFVNIYVLGTSIGTTTNENGTFELKNVPTGKQFIVASFIGFEKHRKKIEVLENEVYTVNFTLEEEANLINDVVVTGTMKEMSKLNSPVPVEVFTARYFENNKAPSIFEALQNVNGVRPQLNCNVCNTGDIHINGLEGPYTMVLIDGMPIVSGLATVYGLTGIPSSLIERVEIVKGPASTLYGSEAVGGLINVITKKPLNAPLFAADVFTTSWGEVNADIASKYTVGNKVNALLGVNYFNYSNPIDQNNDGFTDITLQDRISIFNKLSVARKSKKELNVGARFVYEDRWGGQMNWTPEFRGGDSIYGESIYTNRWELFGNYQLPTEKDLNLQFSAKRRVVFF